MRSTIGSLIIGLVIVTVIGGGGYLLYKKFVASADTASTAPSADLNSDGKVDSLDLNLMIKQISSKVYDARFDLNQDGTIDSADLDIINNNYKK